MGENDPPSLKLWRGKVPRVPRAREYYECQQVTDRGFSESLQDSEIEELKDRLLTRAVLLPRPWQNNPSVPRRHWRRGKDIQGCLGEICYVGRFDPDNVWSVVRIQAACHGIFYCSLLC